MFWQILGIPNLTSFSNTKSFLTRFSKTQIINIHRKFSFGIFGSRKSMSCATIGRNKYNRDKSLCLPPISSFYKTSNQSQITALGTQIRWPVGVLIWLGVKINKHTVLRPIFVSWRRFKSFTNLPFTLLSQFSMFIFLISFWLNLDLTKVNFVNFYSRVELSQEPENIIENK